MKKDGGGKYRKQMERRRTKKACVRGTRSFARSREERRRPDAWAGLQRGRGRPLGRRRGERGAERGRRLGRGGGGGTGRWWESDEAWRRRVGKRRRRGRESTRGNQAN